jgi:hypothetical protein
MPVRRIYCFTLRPRIGYLDEFDTDSEYEDGAKEEWGEFGSDWIAIRAETTLQAFIAAVRWCNKPLAMRERISAATLTRFAVVRLVTCGTCS